METRCWVWGGCGWCGRFDDKSWRWKRLEIVKRGAARHTLYTTCGRDYNSWAAQPYFQLHKEVSTTLAFCVPSSTQCPRTPSRPEQKKLTICTAQCSDWTEADITLSINKSMQAKRHAELWLLAYIPECIANKCTFHCGKIGYSNRDQWVVSSRNYGCSTG